MCVCIYINTHKYIHTYIHTYMHACMHERQDGEQQMFVDFASRVYTITESTEIGAGNYDVSLYVRVCVRV